MSEFRSTLDLVANEEQNIGKTPSTSTLNLSTYGSLDRGLTDPRSSIGDFSPLDPPGHGDEFLYKIRQARLQCDDNKSFAKAVVAIILDSYDSEHDNAINVFVHRSSVMRKRLRYLLNFQPFLTVLWISCIFATIAIPVAMLIIGISFVHKCPSQPVIPKLLIVLGSSITLSNALNIINQFSWSSLLVKINVDDKLRNKIISLANVALNVFSSICFLTICVWIYSHPWPSYLPGDSNYCHPLLYLFAFWSLNLFWIFLLFLIAIAAIGILNFFFFAPIDIAIILGIKTPKLIHTSNNGWVYFVDGFSSLDKANILTILICVRLLFHILWLITIPLVFIGNATSRRRYLLPWEYIAMIKFLYMLVTTTYFVVEHSSCGFLNTITTWLKDHWSEPTQQTGQQMARFVTFLDLADGGPVFWVVLILLTCYVHIRGLQIRYQKEADSVANVAADIQLVPLRIPRAKLSSTNDLSKDTGTCYASAPPRSADGNTQFYYDNLAYQNEYRKY